MAEERLLGMRGDLELIAVRKEDALQTTASLGGRGQVVFAAPGVDEIPAGEVLEDRPFAPLAVELHEADATPGEFDWHPVDQSVKVARHNVETGVGADCRPAAAMMGARLLLEV